MVFSLVAAGAVLGTGAASAASQHLLNVSYSPTRELYKTVNPLFVKEWKTKTGNALTIDVSYGGSGAQSRAVLDGLDADVVTLGVEAHISVLAKAGLLAGNWKTLLPDDSAPYTSTIVFLVRKGNPKHIRDWADLVKPGVQVITPNPKTSGAAQLSFLAAWIYAKHRPGGNDKTAEAFVSKLYHNVPVLDTSGRGATITFSRRAIGDVLLDWENEAHLALREQRGQYEIVYPSSSILAEPPIAVVTKNAQRHGTTGVAAAYLKFLYTPQAQAIEAANFYRPRDPEILAKFAATFPKIKLYTIQQEFGGWPDVEARFFADGKIFDRIYKPGR
jgi:sulfate transport system substrate-binding protein